MKNLLDRQVRRNDCGISAAKTICNILNANISRTIIEDNIYLSEDGASLQNINKFFQEHGFKTKFSLLDVNSINGNQEDFKEFFPCIVPVKASAGLHYIVLNDLKNYKFTVLDPAREKPYQLTVEEFRGKAHYSSSPLDYIELEDVLRIKVKEELDTHGIKLNTTPSHQHLVTLFNKLTYFTHLSENFGFKDEVTSKKFLNDLIFNQELEHIPKHFEGLKYKETYNKINIKAPVLLTVNTGDDTIMEAGTAGIQNVYWRLFKSIASLKQLWFIFLMTSIIASLIAYVAVFVNQILIDHILPSYELGVLQVFALGVAIFYFIDTAFSIYQKFISIHLSNSLDRYFLSIFDKKLSTFSIRYLHGYKRGDLTERLSDVMKLKTFFVSYFSRIFVNVLTGCLSFIFLLMMNLKYSILVLGVLVIFGIIFVVLTPIIEKLERERYVIKASFFSKFIEKIEGIQVIKALRLEEYSSNQIRAGIDDLIRIHTKSKYVGLFNSVLTDMVIALSSILLMVLTSREMILYNTMTLGMIITFLALSGKIFSAFSSLLNSNLALQEHKVILKRFFDFDENKTVGLKPEDEEDKAEDKAVYADHTTTNQIVNFEFEQFSMSDCEFSYDGEKVVIKDVNLDISKGEKIWIEGKNGTGKSTLCKIIGLIYKPTAGNIMLNDVDINFYNKDRLRSKIVFISGEDILFNESVLFNIGFGRKIDMKLLVQYAKAIGFYDFISEKKGKFNFIIQENGKNLSTGQRKKVLLLRALMTTADLILLDEIFSGYDVESKQNAEKLINSFEDRAFIIISHMKIEHISFDQEFKITDGFLRKQDSGLDAVH